VRAALLDLLPPEGDACMSRWWRAHDEAVDDPKLQQLPGELFKAWFNLCCVTSQNGGVLPAIGAIAFKLHTSEAKAKAVIGKLRAAGLIDDTDDHVTMHNWGVRQYKSDVSTERVKRFREQERNVSSTVSATPPETEAETDTEPEKRTELRSDAGASPDIRSELFGRGLKSLAGITGKTPDSCRSLVGKWLKSVHDEAIHVLGAIDDAERNRVADPVAWINRALQPHGANGHGKRSVHDAASDLLERVRTLDDPIPSELRDGEGKGAVRRIPAR